MLYFLCVYGGGVDTFTRYAIFSTNNIPLVSDYANPLQGTTLFVPCPAKYVDLGTYYLSFRLTIY